jgi:hypothetical protein
LAQTVFWSWQSDQPSRETRSLIRDALIAALDRIAVDLEEADRPEIDHDTKDMPGSPDIVASILAKIEAAAVFIADVTPIAVTDGGKHVANPNVLIELGYAKRALGTERVITVWNTALTDAKPEDLPFDMRHRRGPVAFHLPIGAPTAELRKVRTDVSSELERRIRASLQAAGQVAIERNDWKDSEPDIPGIWKDGGTPLPVNLGYGEGTKIRPEGAPFGFARLLPTVWVCAENWAEIMDSPTGHPLPLGRCSGMDYGPTTGGFLIFRSSETVRESGVTPTATRWFKDTGELWGVASSFFNSGSAKPVFATQYAIQRWSGWIAGNARVAMALGGKGPWRLRLGAEGLSETSWPNRFGSDGGAFALEGRVEREIKLAEINDDTVAAAVREVFNAMAEAYGLPPLTVEQFRIAADQ